MIPSRLKERGGAGGKVFASKPSKSLDQSSPAKLRPSSVRKSAPVANLNPGIRSVSAGRRRDPTPNRVEKPAFSVTGVRKSTSSVPKSRGPLNPSDFSRLSSAIRTDRTTQSRVSVTDRLGRTAVKENESEIVLRRNGSGGVRVLEKEGSKGSGVKNLGSGPTRVLEKCNFKSGKKSDNIVPGLELCNKKESLHGKVTVPSTVKLNGEICQDKAHSVVSIGNFSNPTSIDTNSKIDSNQKKTISLPTFTVKWDYVSNGGNLSKIGEIKEKERSDLETKEQKEVKVMDKVKMFEKEIDDSSLTITSAKIANNNYPSKLHEKLAMLEGRVQKIASEIKRTKEILDDNNPDESKLILSEIQNKISSVEKAVGHVVTDKTKTLNPKPDCPKYSSKGLNCEELELRFFPHQKLMKDSRSKNVSVNIDEKSIETEFLDLLTGTKKLAFSGTGIDTDSGCSSKNAEQVQGSFTEEEIELHADEKFEEIDSQESKLVVPEETEEMSGTKLREIGTKCATGGWFVSEGESVLLAHGDGTCLYYDIINCEDKTEYKPPKPVPVNTWGDCWLVRAPGTDGCSGRYVIAASSGPTLNPGFCTWDFYKKEVTSFNLETESPSNPELKSWFYRPCGPLLLCASSKQKNVSAFDIRDGDLVMKWEVNNAVGSMDHSSPLQWRSRGKVVISGNETISLWDVNSISAQPLLSIGSGGKRVCTLHVSNTDAEIGGGIRQRVSSSEAEGNDGVFSTQDSVNILDFRVPTGTGTKISRHGGVPASIFSRGDSVFLGCTEDRLQLRTGKKSRVQHFSLRKGKLVSTYEFPELNSDFITSSVSQVWGNSSIVLGVCAKGLFAFDAFKDGGCTGTGTVGVREVIGMESELQGPTFDYSGSRVLLVSRNRPALWRYLS